MKCTEFFAQLDGYLDGKLSGDRQEAFELHYFECDDCFAQLKIAERLRSKEVHIIASVKEPVPFWRRWGVWKPVLAFAALLLVVIFPTMSIIDNIQSKRLEFFRHITDVPAPAYLISEIRDSGTIESSQDQILEKAMVLYNEKKYDHALTLLNRLHSAESGQGASINPQVVFFKGICLLYTHRLGAAVKTLDVIIDAMNPSYYDEAIYYKAIALLRLDKKAQAIVQLNHLAGMYSPFTPKAKELLKKLD